MRKFELVHEIEKEWTMDMVGEVTETVKKNGGASFNEISSNH